MPLPDDRKSVGGGRWVYSVKSGPDAAEKYKARYVAKGYSQVLGVDYHTNANCSTARFSCAPVGC